jgi:hypothetical protein
MHISRPGISAVIRLSEATPNRLLVYEHGRFAAAASPISFLLSYL